MAPKSSYVNPEGSSLILLLFQTFRFLFKLLTQLLFTFLSVDNTDSHFTELIRRKYLSFLPEQPYLYTACPYLFSCPPVAGEEVLFFWSNAIPALFSQSPASPILLSLDLAQINILKSFYLKKQNKTKNTPHISL